MHRASSLSNCGITCSPSEFNADEASGWRVVMVLDFGLEFESRWRRLNAQSLIVMIYLKNCLNEHKLPCHTSICLSVHQLLGIFSSSLSFLSSISQTDVPLDAQLNDLIK